MTSIIMVLFINGLIASAIGIVPIFVEIHRETDSVLESLAASLCIILLTWLLFAAFVCCLCWNHCVSVLFYYSFTEVIV